MSSPAKRDQRIPSTVIPGEPRDPAWRGKGTQVSQRVSYSVYMLASQRNGTLYVGVTNNLARRVGEHRDKVVPGFTRRYGVSILVWYEVFDDINDAIVREKQIKGWNRAWKIKLIEKHNSGWNDLAPGLI